MDPDGKWIVYTSWNGNDPHLYKIPVAGGRPSQIGTSLAREAQISPDGKSIVCKMQDPNTSLWTVAVIPFGGEGQAVVFPTVDVPVRWSPDGRALTSVRPNNQGVPNIWATPLDGSTSHQLTNFDDDMILTFAWSPKGHRLACIRASSTGDAMLLKKQKSK
jgi:Tol biopolymer transport system component